MSHGWVIPEGCDQWHRGSSRPVTSGIPQGSTLSQYCLTYSSIPWMKGLMHPQQVPWWRVERRRRRVSVQRKHWELAREVVRFWPEQRFSWQDMAEQYTWLINCYKWIQINANGLFWKNRQDNREEMLDKLKRQYPGCFGRCWLQTRAPDMAESSRAQTVVPPEDFSWSNARCKRDTVGHNLSGSWHALYAHFLYGTQLKFQPGVNAGDL